MTTHDDSVSVHKIGEWNRSGDDKKTPPGDDKKMGNDPQPKARSGDPKKV